MTCLACSLEISSKVSAVADVAAVAMLAMILLVPNKALRLSLFECVGAMAI